MGLTTVQRYCDKHKCFVHGGCVYYLLFITVAKYCDEYVCVCLSVCLCLRGYLRSDLYQFLCMLSMAVARSFSGGFTKSQGEGAILGVLSPTDNALHSIAFGTRIKTTEPIEMPFRMKSGLGSRNSVLYVGMTIPEGEGTIFGKIVCQTSIIPQ